jgi:hypothetical protein
VLRHVINHPYIHGDHHDGDGFGNPRTGIGSSRTLGNGYAAGQQRQQQQQPQQSHYQCWLIVGGISHYRTDHVELYNPTRDELTTLPHMGTGIYTFYDLLITSSFIFHFRGY